MGYSINLTDPVSGNVLELDAPHHMRGSTYAVGGDTRLCLNVTYNYAKHFCRVFGEKGIRSIYGMTGAESLSVLGEAISQLGNDVDPDYWTATEGNAKAALFQLRAMALLRPDGVWSGD